MTGNVTIASPFVRNACRGARHAGLDVDTILLDCGIFPESLRQDRNRVPLEDFVRLVRTLMIRMNDECLGLSARPLKLGSFALIARSALHETRLTDALRAYVEGANLFDHGLIHEAQIGDHEICYRLHREPESPLRSEYMMETTLLTVHRFICWLGRFRVPVSLAELDYPAPEWQKEYRYLFYGAPIKFSANCTCLHMDLPDPAAPVRRRLPELLTYISGAPRDIFTPLSSRLTSQGVQGVLIDSLNRGEPVPTLPQCAALLGLQPHQLWRGLNREGTDYRALRSEICRDLSQNLLRETDLAVEQIAARTGYSEASAFIRAFRRWTGMTPRAYRRLRTT